MSTYALKFILIGDGRVGKSQLSRSFTRKTFVHDSQVTIGLEFTTRSIEFEKCTVKAQIWDTAGQERFESMTKAYFRDAVGAALVYDVTSRQSFLNLQTTWLNQLREFGHEGMKVVLVGNKIDLLEREDKTREVSIDEAKEFAQAERFDYIETSALSGHSVELLFRRMVLSAAKLLPEVKTNLELSGLPDGWMVVLPPPPTTDTVTASPSSNPPSIASTPNPISYLDAVVKKPRQISEDCGTSIETTSDGLNSYSNRIMKTSSASSLENYKRTISTDTVKSSPRVCYMNYWTGEIKEELPDTEAPAGLLYIAPKKKRKTMKKGDSTSRDTSTVRDTMDTILDLKDARDSEIDPSLRSSIDDKALTERSSSAKTITLHQKDDDRRRARCSGKCVIL